MDRELIKEMTRELKEKGRGKPYFKTIKPKFQFLIQVLKLVFADIRSHKPFRSKRKEDLQTGNNQG